MAVTRTFPGTVQGGECSAAPQQKAATDGNQTLTHSQKCICLQTFILESKSIDLQDPV